MASKRVESKDTIEREIGDMFEQISMSFPIYEDTMLFIYKDIKIKWKNINGIFSSTFEDNLEDHRVYVNIHKSGLYQVACRYPALPCIDMIHWTVSHTDLEKMLLSCVSGTELTTFRAKELQVMYQLLQSVITMDSTFTKPSTSTNARDILKS